VASANSGNPFAGRVDFVALEDLAGRREIAELQLIKFKFRCGPEDTKILGSCRVRLAFEDRGPGIPDIEAALKDGFTTGPGLGLGLGGARRLTNEFCIESNPGGGTKVTIALEIVMISVAVNDESQVAKVRREATAIARQQGFNEVDVGRVAIVVTSLPRTRSALAAINRGER